MKKKMVEMGNFLGNMVLPNIGVFITWGIITALFSETGWFPNSKVSELINPISSTLLPLLIAYTGGNIVGGQRGGVIGTIAATGVIVGSDSPMFIGAMLLGPLSAWVIKKVDAFTERKVPENFKPLFGSFSLGILGAVFALGALYIAAPLLKQLNEILEAGVGFFVERGLLPLTSILIEPAKVLFLNNAIAHGVLSPMGIGESEAVGKSIYFLLEANPGPGLGILLAYCFAGPEKAKATAPGAIVVHLLGGIHETYFPYVMMNPLLFLAVTAGGMSGVLVLSLTNAGLVSVACPASLITIAMMTERHSYLGVFLGILVSAAVSFIIGFIILKTTNAAKKSKLA